MITPEELLQTLGQCEDAPPVISLVNKVVPPFEITKDAQFKQTWFTSLEAGISLLAIDGRMNDVSLYSEMTTSRGAWNTYNHPLPLDLSFGMSRESILERFGPAHMGTSVHWGIYRLPTFGFRVGYANGKLVTFDLLWEHCDWLPPITQ